MNYPYFIQGKKMDLKEKTYNELLQIRSDLFDKGNELATSQVETNEAFQKAKEEHYKKTEALSKEFQEVHKVEKEVAEIIKNHPDNPKNKPSPA